MSQFPVRILDRLLDLRFTTDGESILVAVRSLCGVIAVLTGNNMGQCVGLGANIAMTCSRGGLLCYENSVTDRAVLAFGLAGGGTSCGNGFVYDLGVSLGVYIVVLVSVGTTGAGVGGVALCGTGGEGNLGSVAVTQSCGFCVGISIATACTGIGGVALGGTDGGSDRGKLYKIPNSSSTRITTFLHALYFKK